MVSDSNQQPLCALEDIPADGSRGFPLGKFESIFAIRKNDQLYLYRNRCPHAGLELNWMPDRFLDRDGKYIICSAHGAMFTIENGECIGGPCAGAYLESVEFHLADGLIYLT